VESKSGTYTHNKYTNTIYNNTAGPPIDHMIHMGKGSNYLVFKEENDQRLHIIASCDPYSYFNNKTYTCDPCEVMTRTFGVQSSACWPCIDLNWYASTDFKSAILGRTCRSGFIKSIIMSTFFPLLMVILAVACCLTGIAYKKKGSFDDDDTSEEIERYREF
jgi:hypothetical protein